MDLDGGRRMLTRSGIGGLLLAALMALTPLAASRPARAGGDKGSGRVTLGAALGARFLHADTDYLRDLQGYGWGFANTLALDLRLDLFYAVLPWIEVGGSVGYLYHGESGSAPPGSDFADSLGLHALETSAVARAGWLGGDLYAGVEVALGAQLPMAVLRGEVDTAAKFLLRPALFAGYAFERDVGAFEVAGGYALVHPFDDATPSFNGFFLTFGIRLFWGS